MMRTRPSSCCSSSTSSHKALPGLRYELGLGRRRARVVHAARRRWRIRWIVLGTAIYFSTLPLSVTFNRSGFQGLLIDSWPERIVIFLVAAVLWAAYAVLVRRWRSPGR